MFDARITTLLDDTFKAQYEDTQFITAQSFATVNGLYRSSLIFFFSCAVFFFGNVCCNFVCLGVPQIKHSATHQTNKTQKNKAYPAEENPKTGFHCFVFVICGLKI